MNLLYPKIPLNRWPAMLGIAGLGAIIAGLYGIVHDQVTYSISAEYFTRLKFMQFHWANLGLPLRFFVAEIGFLATWWVGFFAGWVLARVMAPHAQPRQIFALSLRGFVLVVGFALAAACTAYIFGRTQNPQPEDSGLAEYAELIHVNDVTAFVRVAYIHNASYLGGLLGVIVAAFVVNRKARQLLRSHA
jgi:hypothetical protein